MADAPPIPPGGPPADCQQTTQLRLPDVWLWPGSETTTTPTRSQKHAPPCTGTTLRHCLASVLAGLRRPAT